MLAEKRVEDERIWIYRDDFHYPQIYSAKHPVRPSTEYIRADVVERIIAERSERERREKEEEYQSVRDRAYAMDAMYGED